MKELAASDKQKLATLETLIELRRERDELADLVREMINWFDHNVPQGPKTSVIERARELLK